MEYPCWLQRSHSYPKYLFGVQGYLNFILTIWGHRPFLLLFQNCRFYITIWYVRWLLRLLLVIIRYSNLIVVFYVSTSWKYILSPLSFIISFLAFPAVNSSCIMSLIKSTNSFCSSRLSDCTVLIWFGIYSYWTHNCLISGYLRIYLNSTLHWN